MKQIERKQIERKQIERKQIERKQIERKQIERRELRSQTRKNDEKKKKPKEGGHSSETGRRPSSFDKNTGNVSFRRQMRASYSQPCDTRSRRGLF
jgi:hypothetical protein